MNSLKKAYGLFIRHIPIGRSELLVFTTPIGTLRFPGGTVNENEEVLAGLRRELREEMGIDDFKVLRRLGAHRYYKPDIQARVERHDYLLKAVTTLPERFSFTVNSRDKDNGLVFDYQWIGYDELHLLDWEFRGFIRYEYIPEFFTAVDEEERGEHVQDRSAI